MMGWGSKAIEIRAVENGQLDGVFMHKRTQKLRFLCERNDKVRLCLHRWSGMGWCVGSAALLCLVAMVSVYGVNCASNYAHSL